MASEIFAPPNLFGIQPRRRLIVQDKASKPPHRPQKHPSMLKRSTRTARSDTRKKLTNFGTAVIVDQRAPVEVAPCSGWRARERVPSKWGQARGGSSGNVRAHQSSITPRPSRGNVDQRGKILRRAEPAGGAYMPVADTP